MNTIGKFNKALFVFVLFSVSAYAQAVCPPIIGCSPTGKASTIAGSNADRELIAFAQNITTSTNQVAEALMNMANSNAGALSTGSQSLISAQMELSQIQLNQKLKTKKAMSDRDMAHAGQLAENAYKSANTVVSSDDTKEEFELIIKYLSESPDLSVPELILVLKETMDDDDELGYVMVPIKSAEGVCSQQQIAQDGQCAIAKRVFPSKKLQTLFQQCSLDKRILKESEAKVKARSMAIQVLSEATGKALESTSSTGAITSRLSKQLTLSCTPNQFKNNLCDVNTPEEYQESIVTGSIIPNGSVSAGNFKSPSFVSSHGYIDDMTPETMSQLESASLDRRALDAQPNQKIVPLQHTYRNANQVKAAMNFIDNLVADDLIPALDPSDRRKAQNAEYQSRFLNQIASGSMVRMVLSESMMDRVGTEMRKMMSAGTIQTQDKFEIKLDSPVNKESIVGAGPLDILSDRVNQQASSLQLSDQNGEGGSVDNDFITAASNESALDKILTSMQIQNEMSLSEYKMLEQSNALKSIAVSQKANSPRVVEMMKKLRRGN
jgi:hypothetical protein